MKFGRFFGRTSKTVFLFGVLCLTAGCSRPDSEVANRHIDVLLDWQPTPSFIGFYMAEEAGLYREANLDISFSYGKGASDAAKIISTGKYAAGTSSAEATVVGITKGMPILSRAVLYPIVSTVLLSRTDLLITQPADLYGKKVGLNPSSATYHDYMWLVGKYKLDRSQIEEINIGFGVTPLLTKQVDVILDYSEQSPVELKIQGHGIQVKRLRDFGLDSYGFNIIVNAQDFARRRQVLDKFVETSLRGYQLARDNPNRAAEVFSSRYPERSHDFVIQSVREVVTNLSQGPTGDQTVAGWQNTINNLALSGLIPQANEDLAGKVMGDK